jgi:hypothetical protein
MVLSLRSLAPMSLNASVGRNTTQHGATSSPAGETLRPLPTARMIAIVPRPSALNRTIRARHTCFYGLLRSPTIDCKRPRSAGVTSMLIPLRMSQNRTADAAGQQQYGLFC